MLPLGVHSEPARMGVFVGEVYGEFGVPIYQLGASSDKVARG